MLQIEDERRHADQYKEQVRNSTTLFSWHHHDVICLRENRIFRKMNFPLDTVVVVYCPKLNTQKSYSKDKEH